MPSILVLYPAYGTTSCGKVARYAQQIPGLKLALATEDPTSYDEDIFNEVIEIPPPEDLAKTYTIMRRWCEKRRPDGIFMQSERGLLLGSLLTREFGLKGPTVEAAHLCSNKYLQRLALSRAGIGNPLFGLAESTEDVRRMGRDFGFPIVLKCIISTMSRLVTLIYSEEDVDTAVARMGTGLSKSLDVARLTAFAEAGKVDLGCDPRRQFLVESYLEGDLVETDGLVIGRKPFTFGVTEQIQSVDPPFFIEGYLFPAECSDNGPIEAVSDAVIAALGLGDSAFSIEMRVCGHETCIVEVNGRLGWDEAFSELFQVRTQRERIFQTIQLALGIQPELIRDESRFAAVAYRPCYYDGIIEDLPTRDELDRLEHHELKLGLATHEGARFVAPPNPETYPHVAWALATHPASSHLAYQIARQAVDKLDISIRRI
jgi:hypothetical protein